MKFIISMDLPVLVIILCLLGLISLEGLLEVLRAFKKVFISIPMEKFVQKWKEKWDSSPIKGRIFNYIIVVMVLVVFSLYTLVNIIYNDGLLKFVKNFENSNNSKYIKRILSDNSIALSYEYDYVFPNSSKEDISLNDLENMNVDKLCIAKNEIYARHGHIFNSKTIRNYFESKNWYYPVSKVDFDKLNKVEQANVSKILTIEKNKESPYLKLGIKGNKE